MGRSQTASSFATFLVTHDVYKSLHTLHITRAVTPTLLPNTTVHVWSPYVTENIAVQSPFCTEISFGKPVGYAPLHNRKTVMVLLSSKTRCNYFVYCK